MNLSVTIGDVTKVPLDALVINLFEGVKQPGGATGAIDAALGGAISQLIQAGEVTGKRGELPLVHTLGRIAPARVVVAGLGKREKFDVAAIRDITAEAMRLLKKTGCARVGAILHGAGIGGIEAGASAQAIAEGAVLGLYTFTRHLSKQENEKELKELVVVERDASKQAAIEAGLARGRTVAESVNLARDLINEPGNIMTPTELASQAVKMAQAVGLEHQVLEKAEMERLGMGGILAVSMGTVQLPKFIILRYWGDPGHKDKVVGLVGKGVTFDTGGISLKPAEGMGLMKTDMSGGASVIAAMRAIALLKPKVNVTGLVPSAENMPSATAQRPGDIIRILNGKTVEVDNTDAEGRLLLADALSYGRRMGLSPMIDLATLTGAIRTTFWTVCTGAFTNDEALVQRVIRSGERTGERIWQLPMYDDYKELNKSDVADLRNSGGRFAGSISAALFLQEFSEDTPWVHLDIAGTARSDRVKGHIVKGASGVPIRTLVQFVLDTAEGR